MQKTRIQPQKDDRRTLEFTVAVVVYFCFSLLAYLPAWIGGPTKTMTCGCEDPAQAVWFLTWFPFALLHGHNPLMTTWIEHPLGANLMDNTAIQLPALLDMPVTLLIGPILSWNITVLAAFFSSALVAFRVFRQFVTWWPAALFGGWLYAFGPYMAGQGYLHLNLFLVPFPPLILLLCYKIIVQQNHNPFRWGILLGVATLLQLFISSEILVTTALMAVIGVLVLVISAGISAISTWKDTLIELKSRIIWAFKAIMVSLGVFVIGAGYPLWVTLRGTRHISGAETVHPSYLSANLLGLIIPTSNQLVAPMFARHIANGFVGAPDFIAENGTYLGVPLLIILGIIIWKNRRAVMVQTLAAVMIIAVILSLGDYLKIGSLQLTWFKLPYLWLHHLPVLENIIPVRFALYAALCAGLLLAIGMDKIHEGMPLFPKHYRSAASSPSEHHSKNRHFAWTIGIIALLPLWPAWPYHMHNVDIPAYFTSAYVKQIPPGSTALIYPFPRVTHAEGMLWQAVTDMRFRIAGGFILTPDKVGNGTEFGSNSFTEGLLRSCFWGHPHFKFTPLLDTRVRNQLRFWGVSTVIIANRGKDPAACVELFSHVFSSRPLHQGGVWIFYKINTKVSG